MKTEPFSHEEIVKAELQLNRWMQDLGIHTRMQYSAWERNEDGYCFYHFFGQNSQGTSRIVLTQFDMESLINSL